MEKETTQIGWILCKITNHRLFVQNLYLVSLALFEAQHFLYKPKRTKSQPSGCAGLHNDVYIKIDIINKNTKSWLFALLLYPNWCIVMPLRSVFAVCMHTLFIHFG